MADVWLRGNRRVLWFAMIGPAAIFALGAAIGWLSATLWLQCLGFASAALGGSMLLLLVWQFRLPRLAYSAGRLLVYLRSGPPFRIPIEIVECFLLGRGPSFLPGRRHAETETATVVVRLAEKAEEWTHREVRPALGSWCDGHIIIRGTWCEPLSVDVVSQLNQRLAAAQTAWHEAQSENAG